MVSNISIHFSSWVYSDSGLLLLLWPKDPHATRDSSSLIYKNQCHFNNRAINKRNFSGLASHHWALQQHLEIKTLLGDGGAESWLLSKTRAPLITLEQRSVSASLTLWCLKGLEAEAILSPRRQCVSATADKTLPSHLGKTGDPKGLWAQSTKDHRFTHFQAPLKLKGFIHQLQAALW